MKKVGRLFLNESERLQFLDVELCCGDNIDVLLYDVKADKFKWVHTTVEFKEGYYLCGLGHNIEGLFARTVTE